MLKRIHIWLVLILMSVPYWAYSTHIVGGTLTYVHNGGSSYTVTLKLYRDCKPGTASFPTNVNITVLGNNGQPFSPSRDFSMPLGTVTPVPSNLDSCAIPPNPMPCVEEGVYTKVVTLPPNPGGYHLYYQLIARNLSLTNIDATCNCVGETFYAQIPGQSVVWLEQFNLTNGTTVDNGATAWNIAAGTPAPASASVNTNMFQVTGANNGTVTWSSQVINISSFTVGANLQANLIELGTLDTDDSIFVYYSLDGGTPVLFSANGIVVDDFANALATQTGLVGNTVQIIIRVHYGASSPTSEIYQFDNILVSGNDFPPNSNPTFNAFPPLFVCVGTQLTFDHAATDIDGDSLVYSLYTPYNGDNGTGALDPTFTGNTAVFTPIVYQPGYSYTNPLGGANMNIDPVTGLLTGVPPTIGQFVVGVKVREYRNGVLVSETLRDFQFNSVVCPAPAQALLSPFNSCGDKKVTFSSQGDTTVTTTFWNFGNLSATNDTSWLNTPSYTYPDTGNYVVTLITNKGTSCADTATAPVYIGWVSAGFTYTNSQCASIPVNFSNTSTISNNGNITGWSWNFGDGGTSTLQNPSHTYNNSGTYTIILTITSDMGCTDTSMATIVVGPRPTVNAGADQTVCASSPSVSLNGSVANATGGTWTSSGTGSFSPAVTSLNATYTLSSADITNGSVYLILTSTGASVCKSVDTVKIAISAQPTSANAGADQTVCGVTSAILSATVPTIGTGVWTVVSGAATIVDPNSPTTTINGLVAGGTYTFQWTVNNGAACTSSDIVVVKADLLPTTAAAGADQVLCNSTVATLAANTPTTGTGAWSVVAGPGSVTSPSSPTSGVTGLVSGDTLIVRWTISKGVCSSFDDVQIIVDKLRTANAGTDQILCNQGPFAQLNGSVSVATGGQWLGGAGSYTANAQTLNATYYPTAAEISAGFVNLILSSTGNGVCPAAKDTVKISFAPFGGTLTTMPTSPTCFGINNGSATVTVSGTITPYTYTWNTVPPQYTPTVSGLANGTYTVTVIDARGCSKNTSVVITQPAILSATVTSVNVSCNGGNNGSATVTASGGNGGYTYSWSPSASTTSSATGLSAGIHTVVLTDSKGCTITKTVNITQPVLLNGTIASTNVSCNAGSNGSITVTASGGTPGYTYTWSPNVSTTASASNLAAGTYTITIRDSKNCTKTVASTITQPNILAVTPSQINISCNGGTTGSASVAVSGGTPAYTYTWSSPVTSTTASATNLPAGNYSVTVNDSKQCSKQITFSITQPLALTSAAVVVKDVKCFNGSTGSIQLSTSGGAPGYTYTWTPNVSSTNVANNLSAGNYSVIIKDQSLCSTNVVVNITSPADIVLSEAHTNLLCYGLTNGTLSIGVSGGNDPYTYSWSVPGIGNQSQFSALPAGTYSVQVTDSNNCKKTISATLTQPDSIAITPSSVNSMCSLANGSAGIAVTGGSPGYTYSWVNQASTANTISNVMAGSYHVYVTDTKGCRDSRYILINNVPGPTITLAGMANVTCNNAGNGTATVNVASGTQPYTYSWSTTPSQNSATATGLGPGVYTVFVTDANGCKSNTIVTPAITQPSVLNAAISSTNVSCNGGNNGTAAVTATGGNGGYVYSWSPVASSAASVSGLVAGSYSVTITDNKGCTVTKSVTITQPPVLNGNLTVTQVSCNSAANGNINVNASGGTSPYTYIWAPNIGTTSTASNLNTGTYTVTIKDAKNCTKVLTTTITQPTALVVTPAQTNVTCNGGNSGTASVTVSGGTPGYTYSWGPSISATTSAVTGLTAGNYFVIVTDAKLCSKQVNFTITQPTLLSLVVTDVQNVNCFSGTNGAIAVLASGGSPSYTYTWTPNVSTSASASGLSAGTYAIKVTDTKGCISNLTQVVSQPTDLVVNETHSNPTCFGLVDGTFVINVSGGNDPYSYSWNVSGIGNQSQCLSLTNGIYSVQVTDSNNCKKEVSTILTEPDSITISSIVNNSFCSQANGSVILNVSGGISPYTYSWVNQTSVTNDLDSVVSGTYHAIVTDANNCSDDEYAVVNDAVGPFITLSTVKDVSCFGGSDGSATVNVSSGTPPFTYMWNTSPVQNTATAVNLTAGVYSVSVTDSNGCVTNAVTVPPISEPDSLNYDYEGYPASCFGTSTGAIKIIPSGGTPGYSVNWVNPAITSDSIGNLAAGSYLFTIVDTKGCSINGTAIVKQPSLLDANILSVIQVSCFGGNDGSIVVKATGGSVPYSYTWSPDVSTLSSASNLSAGPYTVTINDNNNCTKVVNATITEPTVLVAIPSQTNISCYGGNNGTASVVISGGTAGYAYNWLSPLTGATSSVSGLTAGTYSLMVTDTNFCTQELNYIITEPPVLIANADSVKDVNCFSGADAFIKIDVLGGTPAYSFVWSPNISTSDSASGLVAGTYTIDVADQNGCGASVNLVITEPVNLTLSETHSDPLCYGSSDGSFIVTATGGSEPYNYSWNVSGVGNVNQSSSLPIGFYSVEVTDTNNCKKTIGVILIQPDSLSVSSTTNSSLCSLANGNVTLNVTGGTLPYTYSWVNQLSTSNMLDNVLAGQYQAIVTDSNNCSITEFVLLNDIAGPSILSATVQNVSCYNGNNGSATININSGTPPFTYTWNTTPVQTNVTASGLSAGTYTVSVSDSNGCLTAEYTVPIISQPDSLTYDFISYSAQCNGSATGAIKITPFGGTPGYSVNWTNPMITVDSIDNLVAGTYLFTIVDTNGCSKSGIVSVEEPTVLNANLVSSADVSCLNGNDGSAYLSASGGIGPYTYSWLPSGGNGTSATGLIAGNHTIIITDDNQCQDTVLMIISQPLDSVYGTVTVSDALCFGQSTGSATVTGLGGNGTYTYTWNPSLSNGSSIASQNAGSYSVLVSDQKGCSASVPFTINQPTPLATNGSNTSSTCGLSNGSVICQVTGGSGGYSYSWLPTNDTDSSITNIPSGTHYVTITDIKNCMLVDTFIVDNIAGPQIQSTNVSDATCFGFPDGSVEVISQANAYPLSYTWIPAVSTDSVATALSSGTYSVMVADNNGCVDSANITLSQPTILVIDSITVTSVSCNGQNDGAAEVIVSGGTPSYTFSWSNNGQTDAIAYNLVAGTYSVQITDANGCTIQQSTVVDQPDELVVSTIINNNNKCNENTDGAATANVTGGVFPYSYQWTGLSQNTSVADSLGAGTYAVIVTDANGCTTTESAVITEPPPVELVLNGTKVICKGKTAVLTAAASSGNGGPYVYSWQPGNTGGTTHTVSPTETTMYTVFATDRKGCVSPVDTAQITVYTLTAGDIAIDLTTPICPGATTTLSASSTGTNTGPLTYTWSNGIGTGPGAFILTPEAPTTYTVTVSTSCGTAITKSASVKFTPPPKAAFGPDEKSGCPPLTVTYSDMSIATGSDSIVSWFWNFGNGITSAEQNPGAVFPSTGTYYVTLQVTTIGGCTNTTSSNSHPMTVFSTPVANFEPSPSVVYIPNGEIKFVNQSLNAATYTWQFDDGTETNVKSPVYEYSNEGTYDVSLIATDNNGCMDTVTKSVLVSGNILIPNAFTPNPSGPNSNPYDVNSLDNDIFHPYLKGIVEYNFQIFDRWGELIFETKDTNIGWDGYYRDKICQQGMYVWQIDATFTDGRKFSKRGDVTLLR